MRKLLFWFGATLFCLALTTHAQVIPPAPNPEVGSPQPATADPKVPRPHTTPCVVQLFQNLEFADFTAKTFSYTPPSACHAPWAKVVFTADFTVTEGRQFDRTASFYLGHANIYYGTTAEPSSTVSPSWHVERDVTDLSAIFKSPQSGEADLGNFVGTYDGVVYNGIIYADAALEFYPASFFAPAPETPDLVVPMPDAEGGAATLNTTSSQLAQPVTLPTNVERVYLDVITQSQIGDEFWYTCVPNNVANELESCGNTAFREAEISIDDQPAGVAPVYPWIYTGGIDPYLWAPIPGVQTFDFVPYRVDLTPFAGLLSDGNQHTVALSVYNANGYFLATANLLVYTDHGSKKVTGGILSNNLAAAPSPVVTEHLTTAKNGDITGTVSVTSTRNYKITGYLNTSHGKIETTAGQIIQFSNTQNFQITAAAYVQDIHQSTTTSSESATKNGPVVQDTLKRFEYPLILDYSALTSSTGTTAVTTTVQQSDIAGTDETLNGFPIYSGNLLNEVNSTDTLNFDASGNFTGTSSRDSSQRYVAVDSLGYCYDRAITSASGLLTSVKNDGCPGH
ncbi:MAG TPA: peptide-N4-asparagine amidase [Bryobacteraceae bacterium]|nr:peptide-N4-asparagine amidase [Bryobacteraceae bacterium]